MDKPEMAKQKKDNNIGYGKPPRHTRFTKGQSGNPKGRPKGTKNLSTILQKAARERVTVNSRGRTVVMTKLEAAMHQLANKAANGDLKAIHAFMHWHQVFQESEQAFAPASSWTEKEIPAMESILRRIREPADPEANLVNATNDIDIPEPEEQQ